MLAMAAVIATLEAMEKDLMLENVRQVEAHLRNQLAEVPEVTRVRGLGFLLGLEFADKVAPIHEGLLARNVITGTSSDPNVLRLLPPLCLKIAEIDLFVDELKNLLATLNPQAGGVI